LRRFLATAAFVALAAGLLVPSVASAADERTLTASVFGTGPGGVRNAGTARVPKPVSLTVNLFTHDDRVPNPFPLGSSAWLQNGFVPNPGLRDRIFLPRTIRLSIDGFAGCSDQQVVVNPARCPRPVASGPRRGSGGSLLGSGRAVAQIKGCSDPNKLATQNQQNPPIQEVVTINLYKGTLRNTLVAHLFATQPVTLNAAIIIRIANPPTASLRSLYSRMLSFQVPNALLGRFNQPGAFPPQGVCVALRIVNLTVRKAFFFQRVSLGRGRFALVRRFVAESVGCSRRLIPRPARNLYPFRNDVTFTNGVYNGGTSWGVAGSDVALATPNCRV
jgi:hypothetical protein